MREEMDRLDALESRIVGLEEKGTMTGSIARLLRFAPLIAIANLLIATPAVLISLAVAYFAFQQAEATEKIQVATVWPILAFDTGNLSDAGEPVITLNVRNKGVGPARIRGMEVSYGGKSYRDVETLLGECCKDEGDELAIIVSAVNGEVLLPGEVVSFLRAPRDGMSPASFDRLEEVRFETRVRICYCSVFDDCWIEDSMRAGQYDVDSCPADWVQYGFPEGVSPVG